MTLFLNVLTDVQAWGHHGILDSHLGGAQWSCTVSDYTSGQESNKGKLHSDPLLYGLYVTKYLYPFLLTPRLPCPKNSSLDLSAISPIISSIIIGGECIAKKL